MQKYAISESQTILAIIFPFLNHCGIQFNFYSRLFRLKYVVNPTGDTVFFEKFTSQPVKIGFTQKLNDPLETD